MYTLFRRQSLKRRNKKAVGTKAPLDCARGRKKKSADLW